MKGFRVACENIMISRHGKGFRATGPMLREPTDHQWIPLIEGQ